MSFSLERSIEDRQVWKEKQQKRKDAIKAKKLRNHLLKYRGRVSCLFMEHPEVPILCKTESVFFDSDFGRVIMLTSVRTVNGDRIYLDVYPNSVVECGYICQNHINPPSELHCLVSAKLLDWNKFCEHSF